MVNSGLKGLHLLLLGPYIYTISSEFQTKYDYTKIAKYFVGDAHLFKLFNLRNVFFLEIKSSFEAGNVVSNSTFNPFKPAFTIVISIHYKPRIAVAILDMLWKKMTRSGLQIEKNIVFIKLFHENWCSKTLCTDVGVGNNLIFQRCKMML